ncbi:MAG: YjbQ family protein [Bacteroidales bacterium]|nr:MAG: YjbQ family protein [Bacteroidales bacterium]
MVEQLEIVLPPYKRGFHLITDEIVNRLPNLPKEGIANIFIKHTSAAITINENADSTVRTDFETFFNRLIPDSTSWFTHNTEGNDDMPAHVKASIIGQFLSIPITNYKFNLGTWQGIYLCEFRNYGGNRRITVTILS